MSSAEGNTTARKRLRTGDNEAEGAEAAAVSTVKSPDFYYADGSIVLRTASKDGRVHTLFRVHKSILAQHCVVFRGMFGEEDTVHFAGVSEQVDGVPLVHLHDEAEDVEDFLRALYDPDFMHRHHELTKHGLKGSDFPKMCYRTMRLAKKYEAERLCANFASALRQAWPAKWDAQEARWKAGVEIVDNDESYQNDQYNPINPNPAWSIRMAIDHDIMDVLPYACYDFCEYIAPDASVVRSDGQDVRMHQAVRDTSMFSPNEMLCLMLGGRRLASYVYEHSSARPVPDVSLFPVPPSSTHTCYDRICQYWEGGQKTFLESLGGAYTPFSLFWSILEHSSTCQSCRSVLKRALDEIGEDIWNKLPVFFRLDNGVE